VHHLVKEVLAGRGRIESKVLLKVVMGGKKKIEKLVCNYEGMKTKKEKKWIKGPTTCRNCGLLGHRASSYKCELNGTKKRQVTSNTKLVALIFYVLSIYYVSILPDYHVLVH
jgi:hypothetical protein